SSMSEVNVRPSFAALFFAFSSRSSGSLIVVRICLRISARHQYVKTGANQWINEIPSTKSRLALCGVNSHNVVCTANWFAKELIMNADTSKDLDVIHNVTANYFFWQGLRWVPAGLALLVL